MKVILTADVKGTGQKNEVLNVSDGFARNYLFPRKWAVEASPAAVKEIERKHALEEKLEAERRAEAMGRAAALKGKEIRLTAKCGEKGRLYGSITGQEIADALREQHGVDVEKRRIECEPIRQTGEYEATVWVYSGITVKMKVVVTPVAVK
ncbi:MAG: 50S ribosomal protein L9 [Candidatus Limiplasma sp.]|nr:50S ribosomal protein L9 [Candidatus Limiplasma sp.]